jgi:hypothetical protein
MSSLSDTFIGASNTPGRLTWPLTQNSFGPPFFSGPIAANHSAPRVITSGTLQSVSTLLTAVGHPQAPSTAGNGGLKRGCARLPSSDSSSAPGFRRCRRRDAKTSQSKPEPDVLADEPRGHRQWPSIVGRC